MTDPLSVIDDDLKEYYSAREHNTDRAQRAGWRDQVAQRLRYQQLVKVLCHDRNEEFSVADLGCGLGDFYNYLVDTGFGGVNYFGYDRDPRMISAARDSAGLRPGPVFERIDRASEIQSADYVVASGIFSGKFTVADREWQKYVCETLSTINSKSRFGFAFNSLTKYSDADKMQDELYYADPCFLFDFCKKNFSRNVALLHDYEEYDFTIIVRKKPV